MKINPISIQYYKKDTKTQDKALISNPIINSKNKFSLPSSVSFCGLIPNSELLNSGYRLAKVGNYKILNNDDRIIIASANMFLAFLNSPNIWNKKIVLTNDINLKGAEIKPIGNAIKPFKGEFDGNGFKISDFIIKNPEGRNIGLFGKCENAKISNLKIEKAFIRGKQQVGGIAGYAIYSNFENCGFDGYIEGDKKLGGLIGLSKQNSIKNCHTKETIKINDNSSSKDMFGDTKQSFVTSGVVGGLVAADEGSNISTSYSSGTIISNEQTGGLIGYSERSNIDNCNFNGKILGKNKIGGLIGWGENSNISTSYALCNTNNLVGDNSNCSISNSYSDLSDIITKPFKEWDTKNWHLKLDSLPRLKIQIENIPPKDLFLEDLNTDIKTGRIGQNFEGFSTNVSEKIPINIFPPKHYSQNDELLKTIRECNDKNTLFKMFSSIVTNPEYTLPNTEIKEEYKELLLEFVKNPQMDLNRRYYSGYCVNCTPLFIITTINEPYILREALKREDVDPTVPSGFLEDKTILKRAFDNHIDPCVYVLLTSPKMRNIIEDNLDNLKSRDISCLSRLLLDNYPNIPEYDEYTGCINFRKDFDIPKELLEPLHEIQRLQDVQKYTEIDVNYKDSVNNNIANVLTTLDDEKEALGILLSAERIGTYLDHYNNKGENPIGNALYKEKPHLVANLLERCNTPYVRLNNGVDSMLLFSNMEESNYATNYMEIARKRGLSVNSSDNDGNTPLINAVRQKNIQGIKYLLSHGANPNITDKSGQSALHSACINNDIEAINLLLDSYAYPNIRDIGGNLPIDYLNEETQNLLNSRFQDLNDLYKMSCIDGYLISNLPKINSDNYEEIYSLNQISDLILSGHNADKEILNLTKNIILKPDKVNLKDDNDNSVLHLIAQSKSKYAGECLKAAIDAGADINAVNNLNETVLISALNTYICTADTETKINLLRNIKILFNSNHDIDLVDENKQGALHKVCQSGNLILFNEILKLNPKINQVDILGKTPFEYIPPEANAPMYYTAKEYLSNNKILKEIK